jgi:hypothetical protein
MDWYLLLVKAVSKGPPRTPMHIDSFALGSRCSLMQADTPPDEQACAVRTQTAHCRLVMTPIVVGAAEGSAGVPCCCAATELIAEISDSSYTAAAVLFGYPQVGVDSLGESIGPYSSLNRSSPIE